MNNLSKKQLRNFGYLIGFGIPLIIGWFIPIIWGHSFRFWTIWVGIISILLAIFKPGLLDYPYRFWMKIGHVLGWINSRIILGIVFIFILQPIAMIMKLTGYDPLQKKRGKKSYKEYKTNRKCNLTKIF
ncbi:hypothetical protein HA149_09200 [Prochlorococcus marinus XMU1406]|uniref:SxtJ family membrane protein n=1 Tax=Prochlorococcus marinus TaxID=1219 RepID=UPI001ADC2664|nr:SxtJ family membrane protein [Prochlorococcus marinus]MBO8207231.1 hypothetical protein [Prochlorococcus marinus XMU1406]MCR8543046.1 SxtJ family membrane protein [Prochlorococcus marinus XMU1427]